MLHTLRLLLDSYLIGPCFSFSLAAPAAHVQLELVYSCTLPVMDGMRVSAIAGLRGASKSSI